MNPLPFTVPTQPTTLDEAGAIPGIILGKHSDTRIKNKAVGFGQWPRPLHNRRTQTGTYVRWGMAVTYNIQPVKMLLLKRLRNGRFTSETATWTQEWFSISVGTSRKFYHITSILQ